MIGNINTISESERESIEKEKENQSIYYTNPIMRKESYDEGLENGAIKDINFKNGCDQESPVLNLNKNKKSYKSGSYTENISSLYLNKFRKHSFSNKRNLALEDLENREKSKLACLIRKKYTTLMKESILVKGAVKKTRICDSFRRLHSKFFYELASQILQIVISLISVILYVFSTYYPDDSELDHLSVSTQTIVKLIKWGEVAIAIIINVDWIINLIKTNRKLKYLVDFLNILDFIMFIAVYINLIYPGSKSLGFIRVFRIIRIMRIFRLFKIVQLTKQEGKEDLKKEVNRRLIHSILTILAVIFVATGVIHFLNNSFPEYFGIMLTELRSYECLSGKDFEINEFYPDITGININLQCAVGDPLVVKSGTFTFDLAFYYMVITMATVGYGDIYPTTSWMRLIIGIFVIISIITISKQTTELNDIIRLGSQYETPYYESKGIKHVILSGFLNKSILIRFFNEFYHIDHKEKSEHIKIVIIQNESPDKDIQSILLDPKYEDNIHFIQGDIFTDNILEKSKSHSASGIILISDHNHPDASKNDQFLILACKAFSQYSPAKLYVQFKYPQSLLHGWADWDMACSSSQIKMSLIALNGLISGFMTMMMNLCSSWSTPYNTSYRKKPWLHEYIYGATQEIYIINIPENFELKMNFDQFILKSYLNTGSLIIGVKKKVYYQEDRDIFYFVFLLNPIDVKIEKEDALILISNDTDSAQSIFHSKNKKVKHKEKSSKIILNENKEHKEKEKFNYFLHNIKEENLNTTGHNGKKKTMEDFHEANDNRKFSDFNATTSSQLNKNNIPKFFKEHKHFKIWENNPNELDTYFQSHYLIFCKEEQLAEFMKCFNTFYSDIIFFICDHHPSSQWEILIKSYQNLVFIECSYSDYDDLQKLELERAKHVFILSYAVENSNVNDSAILPLVKLIEENFPRCKYTLELSDELNLKYLNNEGDNGEVNFLDESKRSISRERDIESKKRKGKLNLQMIKFPVRLWPKYAKGDIFFSSSLDSLMAFAFHNDGVLEVILKILGISSIIKHKHITENANISMFRYVGIRQNYTYKNIVKNFLKLTPPIIPIAVYRNRTEDNILKNEYPYIITNPKKELDLNRFDKIICIGTPGEKIFEEFIYDNYYEEDEFGEKPIESYEKINLHSYKKKKSFYSKNKTHKYAGPNSNKNMDEHELIEILKQELKNLKLLTHEENENHEIALNKIHRKNSIFNVIQEENYEPQGWKDKNESSIDDDMSVVMKNRITEFSNNNRRLYNNIVIKNENNNNNNNLTITEVEKFEFPGNKLLN